MELSEFERHYNNAQNRFENSLYAITAAIEIVVASQPQCLRTINPAMQIISEHIPQVLNDYEELTAIVDQFFNSQPPQNNPPQS